MPGHSWAGTISPAAEDGGTADIFVGLIDLGDCLHKEAKGLPTCRTVGLSRAVRIVAGTDSRGSS